MSLSTLNYTKDWTNAEDFPTVQTDENQVRADQQFLFNEIKDYLNDKLIPGIESAIEVACQDLVVGQLTDGSVTKSKLSAALIDVISRAELGGDLDARINAESAKKVSKSGDTITGYLSIAGETYPKLFIRDTTNGSVGQIQHFNHLLQIIATEAGSTSNSRQIMLSDKVNKSSLSDALRLVETKDGAQASYNILHTGNVSDLGIAKVATGSYTGTGVGGENNPNSLTFAFVPKVVMICGDGTQLLYGTSSGAHPVFGVLWDQLSSEYKEISGNRYNGMQVKATDKTLSWYRAMGVSDDVEEVARQQLNTSGKVYRYVAFG